VRRILAAVRNPIHRGCFSLIYGCGLRRMWQAKDHRDPRWLFPNGWRTGPVATDVLTRTFAEAVKATNLHGGRRATPHTLRHNSEDRIIPSGHLEAAGFGRFQVGCST
jgi:hypothetical protein